MGSQNKTSISTADQLFAALWNDYTTLNPEAKRIYDSLIARGEKVENDHVAYRTFDCDPVSLPVFQKIFETFGYEKKDEYVFTEKKLFAVHMEHKLDPKLPKIFISQLELKYFSPWLQDFCRQKAEAVSKSQLSSPEFLFSGRHWNIKFSDYKKLLAESEYAAWLSCFGFRPNHFTVSFNSLNTFVDLKALNDFILSKGFDLNSSGGLIKGTPADHLEQSSTMAKEIDVQFEDGTHKVPACYYEFARRYSLPNGKEFSGFVSKSADKIFESTNVKK